jgi:hypothetical protein
MNKYYHINKKIENNEPKEYTKLKRKLNLHVYSNESFMKKFGVEMFLFLGKLSSCNDESSHKKLLSVIKNTDVESSGRKISVIKKKLYV